MGQHLTRRSDAIALRRMRPLHWDTVLSAFHYPYSTHTYRRSVLISTVHCQNSLCAPTGNEFAVLRFFFSGISFLLDPFHNSPIILIAINFNYHQLISIDFICIYFCAV